MNYQNFRTGHNKPTIISGEQYGTKVSIELDHSDTELDELMDAFETIVIGLGYHADAWKGWIVDRAAEYNEEENDKWEEPYTAEDFKKDEEVVFHRLAKKELNEFDDYGKTISAEKDIVWDWDDVNNANVNEWGNEPEEDLEWPEPNEKLKEAGKKYKKAMKAVPKTKKK
jgi:hypothetical protein